MNRDFDIEEKDNDVFIASENLKWLKILEVCLKTFL